MVCLDSSHSHRTDGSRQHLSWVPAGNSSLPVCSDKAEGRSRDHLQPLHRPAKSPCKQSHRIGRSCWTPNPFPNKASIQAFLQIRSSGFSENFSNENKALLLSEVKIQLQCQGMYRQPQILTLDLCPVLDNYK